ncbi:hypothetical protein [uncultured Algibacter sp.]|uniref:hypothetical protein n=1 Tax=uncultured Algibacter sp. TaxID=298659 RepID=UPI003216FC9E
MKNKIILFVSICLMISCKSEKKKPNMESKKTVEIENKPKLLDKYALKVIMDFETDTKGLFQIKFGNPDKTIKPVISYHNVKEENSRQIIDGEYSLESNDFPRYVQLIMGENEAQKIKINEIKLITDEVLININKYNFKNFIQTSSYTDFDENTGILTSKRLNNAFIPAIVVNKRAMDSLSFM